MTFTGTRVSIPMSTKIRVTAQAHFALAESRITVPTDGHIALCLRTGPSVARTTLSTLSRSWSQGRWRQTGACFFHRKSGCALSGSSPTLMNVRHKRDARLKPRLWRTRRKIPRPALFERSRLRNVHHLHDRSYAGRGRILSSRDELGLVREGRS